MNKVNHRRGFTIIELIMLILIMAVLAAVIMQRSNLSNIRATEAAYKIKSDIRCAQSFALATQKRTRISFDVNADTYSVYYESSPGNWAFMTDPFRQKDLVVDLTSGEYRGTDVTQVNFGGSNLDLVFDAAGKPYSYNPAGGAVAELSTQGTVTLGNGQSVNVEPKTGKASIG